MIRLVIVEQHQFARLGLKVALESSGDIRVVGEFESVDEMTAMLERLSPDIVLMSTGWPASEALDACHEFRSVMPMTRVLLMSSTGREEEVVAAIAAGASGHVHARVSRSELLRAIGVASCGGAYFDRQATDRVLLRLRQLMDSGPEPGPATLSERERNVLALIAAGHTNEQIGKKLGVSGHTVRNNITGIRSKLGLYSRARLVGYAYEHGLVGESEDDVSEGEGAL